MCSIYSYITLSERISTFDTRFSIQDLHRLTLPYRIIVTQVDDDNDVTDVAVRLGRQSVDRGTN